VLDSAGALLKDFGWFNDMTLPYDQIRNMSIAVWRGSQTSPYSDYEVDYLRAWQGGGSIDVIHLQPGQKVEWYDSAATLLDARTVPNGQTSIRLTPPGSLTTPPLNGTFKVYGTDGTTLLFTTAPSDAWSGDVYRWKPSGEVAGAGPSLLKQRVGALGANDDFAADTISSGAWVNQSVNGTATISGGFLHLAQTSNTTGVGGSVRRSFLPPRGGFMVEARVRANTPNRLGFVLGDGTYALGCEVDQNFYLSRHTPGWTTTQGPAVAAGIWYRVQLVVSETPYTVQLRVIDDKGALVWDSPPVSDMSLSYAGINKMDLTVWRDSTAQPLSDYDIDEVRSWHEPSVIQVVGLLPGHKVELYDASSRFQDLRVVPAGSDQVHVRPQGTIAQYPFKGFLRICDANGSTLLVGEGVVDLWGGDLYRWVAGPPVSQGAPAGTVSRVGQWRMDPNDDFASNTIQGGYWTLTNTAGAQGSATIANGQLNLASSSNGGAVTLSRPVRPPRGGFTMATSHFSLFKSFPIAASSPTL
jgi:hypothetical protein